MTFLRSFQETKAKELRIRCTMQVWTAVRGNTVSMAPGKPVRPSPHSDQDIPEAPCLELVHHLEPETLAPSLCSIHGPSTSLSPSEVTARPR